MALYPCDSCGRRYPQRQQAIYRHVIKDGTDLGGRLRLCPKCFKPLAELCSVHYVQTQLGDDPVDIEEDVEVSCMFCGSTQLDAQIFAHVYADKVLRHSYWGGVCQEHYPDAIQTWRIGP